MRCLPGPRTSVDTFNAAAGASPGAPLSFQSSAFKAELQRLRRLDNVTNWRYLPPIYLYLGLVIGGAVWLLEQLSRAGYAPLWSLPVSLVAIVLIGVGQHQLSGFAHEASHHILFRNRWLNDLAADWLSMFPLFSSLHFYRVQHLAHHQFINDPERDPDRMQLRTSGHAFPFPLTRKGLARILLRQIGLVRLVRYTLVRAGYNSIAAGKSPYALRDGQPSLVPTMAELAFLVALSAALLALTRQPGALLLATIPWVLWAGFALLFLLLPESSFYRSRVPAFVPLRFMSISRMIFFTLLFQGLAWIRFATGRSTAMYFLLLWVVPLFTSFSYFMAVRQNVQHGNADRGRFTNTRVFHLPRLVHHALFPFGQDYHLPHHLYASVPHYRLRELHALLMRCPEYRDQAIVVEGCLRSPQGHAAPSLFDVLGPGYSATSQDVFIDDSVLDDGRPLARGSIR